MTFYHIKIIRSIERLEPIKNQWERLAQLDSRDGFFKDWDWQTGWFKYFGKSGDLYILIVEDSGGVIKGILPLARYKVHLFPLIQCTVLGFMGREIVSGDYLDVLADTEDKAAVVDMATNWLLSQKIKFSFLMFGEIIKDDPTYLQCQKISSTKGLPIRLQENRNCPYIELPKSFDLYLQSLSKNFRYNIRRRNRKVFIQSGGRVVITEDARGLKQGLKDLFKLHILRWGNAGISCTFENETFRAFVVDVCQKLAVKKSVRLYRLFLKEKSVAAMLIFYWGESAIFYQMGWDPSFKKYSPGVVLMSKTIEDAIDMGKRYYDFLRGDEPYKWKWTNSHRKTTTLMLPNRLAGMGLYRVLNMKDKIRGITLKEKAEQLAC
ncbi:GNAT family N-acetyltransferase [Thermodesulfobacteriota bacterium]